MKPGHCFTIEPMINEGVWGDQTWPDNWTSVTQVSINSVDHGLFSRLFGKVFYFRSKKFYLHTFIKTEIFQKHCSINWHET